MSKVFFHGVLLSVLWSLPLVVPFWLPDFSAVDIVFGRFLVFGLATLVVLPFRLDTLFRLRRETLQHHLLIACIGHVLFYLLLVASIHAIGPFPACVMLGVLPILCCLMYETELRKDPRNAVMIALVSLAVIFTVCDCGEKECLVSGLFFLLLATGFYLCHANMQRKYLGLIRSLDDSDHLLVSGLAVIPCLLLLLPLGHLEDSLFHLFYAHHEPGRWRLFWLCTVVSGFLGTLVVKVLWRYNARSGNPVVMSRFNICLPLLSALFVFIATGHFPARMEWAALISLAAALYLYSQLKTANRSFQA